MVAAQLGVLADATNKVKLDAHGVRPVRFLGACV